MVDLYQLYVNNSILYNYSNNVNNIIQCYPILCKLGISLQSSGDYDPAERIERYLWYELVLG